jgi:superfamily II DNA or RNA helicase
LRQYQRDAIAAVEHELSSKRSTLLVLPTGTGKTVVFADLAHRAVTAGGRVLILAHRTELLDQAAEKLLALGIRASIEQGDRRGSSRADVVIASVQSLRGKRLTRYLSDAFTLIVVDEAHHAAATSYTTVLEHFPRAKILGVTATPDRGDGRALGKIFGSVAFTYDMRTAIREGFLAPLRARRVLVGDIDLSAIRSHHGDFDQAELGKRLTEEKALHGVVSPLVELCGKRRTLVFGVDVAHAHALAEMINRYRPASAIAVDGSAKPEERAAALSLFRAGTFQFLVNCALFTEGFDEPSIECVAMARPTQSRSLYCQMLGRATRLHPGKTHALILDFVGNSKHRLVGPADALGGTLDEETRDQLEKLLATEEYVEDALALAEQMAAQVRARAGLIAIALFREKEIDPFLGDQMPPPDPNAPWASDPASEKQIAALDKAGISKPPAGLTKGDAARILDAITERRRLGLATIPQCRLLNKLKLDTRDMTFSRATQLIVMAKTRGFSPMTFIRERESRIGRSTSSTTKKAEDWL